MQRAEIPDVSLPIGRGATQTLEALVVAPDFCVGSLFICCHRTTRFYIDFCFGCECKCQVSSVGRRRFFGTL